MGLVYVPEIGNLSLLVSFCAIWFIIVAYYFYLLYIYITKKRYHLFLLVYYKFIISHSQLL